MYLEDLEYNGIYLVLNMNGPNRKIFIAETALNDTDILGILFEENVYGFTYGTVPIDDIVMQVGETDAFIWRYVSEDYSELISFFQDVIERIRYFPYYFDSNNLLE